MALIARDTSRCYLGELRVNMHKSIQPFEKAGLGKAPFELVRFEKKPGSRCELCGHQLKNVFWIQGSGGNQFRVGSD